MNVVTGSAIGDWLGTIVDSAFFALKVFTPACCLGSGVIFGKMHGWVWYYFAVTALIFAPSMVLNYSQGDIHYIFEYAALAFVGSLIGYAFHRDRY